MSNTNLTDPAVTDVLAKSREAIGNLLKLATQQEAEITSLKAANRALQDKQVVLEKVASAPVVSEASLNKLVDELVSGGYFSATESTKLASELKNNPEGLVKLASTIIRANTPTTEGSGVTRQTSVKEASAPSSAIEDWRRDGWID